MRELKGWNGESLVLDGGWISKLRSGSEIGRNPLTAYTETQVRSSSRRKFVLFGAKEEFLQVIVAAGTLLSLTLGADRQDEVDAFVADVERAAEEARAGA